MPPHEVPRVESRLNFGSPNAFALYLPDFIGFIKERLSARGIKAYLVGGCVRDMAMGKTPLDWDILVGCDLKRVKEVFSDQASFGFKEMVLSMIFKGYKVEFCSLKGNDLLEDLGRRDFTMNALAYDLNNASLWDPFGGIKDMKEGILRAVGAAKERFCEDPLRMLRAIRFVSELGLKVEPGTLREIRSTRDKLREVAVERIRDEIKKTLLGPYPTRALWLFISLGLLRELLPELYGLKGVKQSHPHRHRLLKHTLICVGYTPPSLYLRIGALLHDIGKPRVKSLRGGRYRFLGHHIVGEIMCMEMMRRLRFPKDVSLYVARLVRHHVFFYTPAWSDKAVRRFLGRINPVSAWELLALRRADLRAHGSISPELSGLAQLSERIERLKEAIGAPKRRISINGNDLKELLGIGEGPLIGKTLKALDEWIAERPEDNDPERLKRIAKEIYSKIK